MCQRVDVHLCLGIGQEARSDIHLIFQAIRRSEQMRSTPPFSCARLALLSWQLGLYSCVSHSQHQDEPLFQPHPDLRASLFFSNGLHLLLTSSGSNSFKQFSTFSLTFFLSAKSVPTAAAHHEMASSCATYKSIGCPLYLGLIPCGT